MKIDPYKHKERFEKWLLSIEGKKEVNNLNETHSEIFVSFIKDFRLGLNVSNKSKKGERSYIRLNNLIQRISFLLRKLEERGILDVRDANPSDLHNLFADMRSGALKTRFGTVYKSTGDYVKVFKTFWHWYQKVQRNKDVSIKDITEDLDSRGEKPRFVYFTKEDFERIIELISHDLKPVLSLAFDSGMRATELINTRISDFSEDFSELTIREEVSKTFGRKIKLMLCPKQIKEYVVKSNLKGDDLLCVQSTTMINKELRNLGKRLLTSEQIRYKNLTLYDFRHSSACYWLPIYKSEAGMKYRFGWKKSDMIYYYTEHMGMKDTINQDDMYVDITKTDLEKEVSILKNELKILQESVRKVLDVGSRC